MICDTLVVDKWAFTAHPEWQKRELGTVTIVILAIFGVLFVGAIALFAVIIGLAASQPAAGTERDRCLTGGARRDSTINRRNLNARGPNPGRWLLRPLHSRTLAGPTGARTHRHAQEPAHRRIARQGQDDQQIPRQGLHRPGLLRPRPRPGAEGGRGRSRQRLRHALRPDREEREARRGHRQGRQGRRRHLPGDRPGSRGRGDQLAHRRDPEGARPAQGQAAAPGGVHRDHPARDQGSDDQAARRSPATWSMPSRRVARWTTWSASTCRRCCGARSSAACPPAACSRRRCA